jgi:hypothetical protein
MQVEEQQTSSLSTVRDLSHGGDVAAPFISVLVDLSVRFVHAVERMAASGERVAGSVERIAASAERLAEVHAPPLSEKVDTTYVAERLDVTPTWVAALARDGEIPAHCIVPGTGDGTPWKFYRDRIDKWLQHRR